MQSRTEFFYTVTEGLLAEGGGGRGCPPLPVNVSCPFMFARLVEMLDTQTSNRTEQALHEASKIADPIDLQSILWAGLLTVHGHFRCKLTISLNLLFSFFAK